MMNDGILNPRSYAGGTHIINTQYISCVIFFYNLLSPFLLQACRGAPTSFLYTVSYFFLVFRYISESMLSRQLLRFLRASAVSSSRTNIHSSFKFELLEPCYLNSKLCQLRHISTSYRALRQTVSAGNIINSHLPDLVIPKDVPFHDYFFDICDKHKDNVALVRLS